METDFGFRPPYMSFQTFWNYIEELAEKPLPPAIDRSIMKSKSGTDQANLTMAFNSFGFTDATGNVLPALTDLIAFDPEERPAAFGALVRAHYKVPLDVSSRNGTPADLNKVFIDEYPSIASADTRRKAITFFLHAARKSGIELSPHFPATRSGQGAPGAPKARRTGTRRRQQRDDGSGGQQPPPPPAGGFSQSVELPDDAGTVMLTASVNPMALKGNIRAWFYKLVDQMDTDPTSGSDN
jgi:hypothetical protein